ncbi:unnamed protein product [Linum tenue]|uniref:Protein kinase domain-containing protein n=1 Tax=Linum tenue TaxID=586396 RepID=A0AAV0IGP1_9ROSI|nr:unnamed protein product [Linum tenue]
MITGDPLGVLSSWNDSTHFCYWYGVSCSRRHVGRVQVLDLRSEKLSGSISPHIGNLSFLAKLVLHNNSLSGGIPSEIGRLRRLHELRLSFNSLEGEIPSNISECSALTIFNVSVNKLVGQLPWQLGSLSKLQNFFDNLLQEIIPSSLGSLRGIQVLDISSNSLSGQIPKSFEGMKLLQLLNFSFNNLEGEVPSNGLCGGMAELNLPPCSFKQKKKTILSHKPIKIVLLAVIGLLFLAFMSSCLLIFWYKKRGKRDTLPVDDSQLLLSYHDLHKATDGFSATNLIGVGSFGSVYKGFIEANGIGSTIAVKVFNLQRSGASRSFMAECAAHQSGTPIVHCDLKPNNVLLDMDMVAHVGDFGLARFLQSEYGMGNKVSIQGDVYSYGILLFEIFTGKRPADEIFKNDLSLRNFVGNALSEKLISKVVDPILLNELSLGQATHSNVTSSSNSSEEANYNKCHILEEAVISILEIGVACSPDYPEERVSMSEVVTRLVSSKRLLRDKLARRRMGGR